MMQTHNILTELNEARCPRPLRCWSQDWRLGRAELHLGDSHHSDNSGIWAEILRRRNNNISQLSVSLILIPKCGEKVSQKIGSSERQTAENQVSHSHVTPLTSFIITMHCNVFKENSANQMPGQRRVDQSEAKTRHNYQRDRVRVSPPGNYW